MPSIGYFFLCNIPYPCFRTSAINLLNIIFTSPFTDSFGNLSKITFTTLLLYLVCGMES